MLVHGARQDVIVLGEVSYPLPSHTQRTVSPALMRTVSGSKRMPPPAPTMTVGLVEMSGRVVVVGGGSSGHGVVRGRTRG